ncbi:MAG: twin-arginine translocase TatA/TatE family subunit [Alphaproteobacteria bacterium]|nr:twin-arginine translocase TatA/TatE family subunit [Alphaproteobacteria bacterium]
MGAIGPWQIVIVLVLAVLLFGGGGKISSLMGDFAKGIKSFRKGLQEDDEKSLEERSDQAMDVTPVKKDEKTGSSAD